eukprot:322109-Pyramimonas_sp.AAC.1
MLQAWRARQSNARLADTANEDFSPYNLAVFSPYLHCKNRTKTVFMAVCASHLPCFPPYWPTSERRVHSPWARTSGCCKDVTSTAGPSEQRLHSPWARTSGCWVSSYSAKVSMAALVSCPASRKVFIS